MTRVFKKPHRQIRERAPRAFSSQPLLHLTCTDGVRARSDRRSAASRGVGKPSQPGKTHAGASTLYTVIDLQPCRGFARPDLVVCKWSLGLRYLLPLLGPRGANVEGPYNGLYGSCFFVENAVDQVFPQERIAFHVEESRLLISDICTWLPGCCIRAPGHCQGIKFTDLSIITLWISSWCKNAKLLSID